MKSLPDSNSQNFQNIKEPMLYTIYATNHAIEHCVRTTSSAYRLPSSLFTVAIAATQGVYKREKTRKTNALKGVNNSGSLSVSPSRSTLNVLTTLSFAINPVIKAVDTLQSTIPRGLNTGTRKFPSRARRLSEEFATRFSLVSKVSKNQMAIVAQKIIVKARVTKSFAFV